MRKSRVIIFLAAYMVAYVCAMHVVPAPVEASGCHHIDTQHEAPAEMPTNCIMGVPVVPPATATVLPDFYTEPVTISTDLASVLTLDTAPHEAYAIDVGRESFDSLSSIRKRE